MILLAAFVLFGCNSEEAVVAEKAAGSSETDSQFDEKKSLVFQKNGISLTEFTDYPVFKDAELALISPKDKARLGKNDFEFEVKNFPMGVPTVEENKLGIRFQKEGQHIKFFYSGHLPKSTNTSIIEENLSAGENYVFAALSRSYNLSIHASPKSYLLTKVTIYDNKSKIETPKGSHLIPISPVGQYDYEFTKKILLDFYLVNTPLSEKGNYVLITIDNTEFKITKWAPFIIEGLSSGIHSVSFKLMDANNHLIPGPFNDIGKIEFTLKEKENILN